ncbi:MAG: Hint domain-containing protein [Pseudomonadota bacterium]
MTTLNVDVYDFDPYFEFPRFGGTTHTFGGPDVPETTATITDNGSGTDDLTLEDNTRGETATITITINGDTSTDVAVSAEESWTLRDQETGETFEMVTLHVESGPAAGYYTISEQPLVAGRTYDVQDFDFTPDAGAGDPVFTYSEYVCFAPGTRIATPLGERLVEALRPGETVLTLDGGPMRVVWIGARTLDFDIASSDHKPVWVGPAVFGPGLPETALVLSPQHRILLTGAEVQYRHAVPEVLGMAKGLVHCRGIRRMHGKRSVTYHSILLERHGVMFANGLAVESFYPGRYAQSLLDPGDRIRLLAQFPGIADDPERAYGNPARPVLKRREVEALQSPSGRGIKPVLAVADGM